MNSIDVVQECDATAATLITKRLLQKMKTAYIIDAVRTPIGRYGGKLSSVRPDDLLALMITALIQRNESIDVNVIEDIIAGAANQAGEDNRDVARMAALLAGLPVTVGGNTVNRLCASGLHSKRCRKYDESTFCNCQK
jgi:acetyl-CoA C-acetyltransferase